MRDFLVMLNVLLVTLTLLVAGCLFFFLTWGLFSLVGMVMILLSAVNLYVGVKYAYGRDE